MHMADALLSPAVGGAMWAASATLLGYSAKKIQHSLDDHKVPLMGVAGAFIFAAQMINFSIPATGSSGHIGGGLFLAILLGPYAAFLTMASVLTIQALLFADGGLLALGCNIFNLGFFPCFIAYPLIYKPLAGRALTRGRIVLGNLLAAIFGLQAGAFGVVLQTVASGISELPFTKFVLFMQPIHLAIGVVEGLATAAVVLFAWQARPELFDLITPATSEKRLSLKPVLIGLLAATIALSGVLSWFASSHPDGLEWAMLRTSGSEELSSPANPIYVWLEQLQGVTALLPDYNLKSNEPVAEESRPAWPAVDAGTSVAGLAGGVFVLLAAIAIALLFKKKRPERIAS